MEKESNQKGLRGLRCQVPKGRHTLFQHTLLQIVIFSEVDISLHMGQCLGRRGLMSWVFLGTCALKSQLQLDLNDRLAFHRPRAFSKEHTDG